MIILRKVKWNPGLKNQNLGYETVPLMDPKGTERLPAGHDIKSDPESGHERPGLYRVD